MLELFDYLQPMRAALLLSVPAMYVVAALLASWRVARFVSALAVGFSAASLALVAVGGPLIVYGLRADALGCIVLLLVCFIGWVITRYSQTYMGGDAGQTRYARWLMATLAAVTVVVVTNHLAVLAAAWLVTSLALHQLLTFFSTRPAAKLVASHAAANTAR